MCTSDNVKGIDLYSTYGRKRESEEHFEMFLSLKLLKITSKTRWYHKMAITMSLFTQLYPSTATGAKKKMVSQSSHECKTISLLKLNQIRSLKVVRFSLETLKCFKSNWINVTEAQQATFIILRDYNFRSHIQVGKFRTLLYIIRLRLKIVIVEAQYARNSYHSAQDMVRDVAWLVNGGGNFSKNYPNFK